MCIQVGKEGMEEEEMEPINTRKHKWYGSALVPRFLESRIIARVISSFVLAPMMLFVVHVGGVFFNSLVALIAMLIVGEWHRMVFKRWSILDVMIGTKLYYIGLFYILMFATSLIYLRGVDSGEYVTYWLLVVTCSTDIGGYCFGIVIGGPKLAPSISPSKTLSGFLGGVMCGCAVGSMCVSLLPFNSDATYLLSILLPIFGHCGDLLESKMKRYFKVKDSGNIIPGHGGLMDRADSISMSAMVLALYIYTCY